MAWRGAGSLSRSFMSAVRAPSLRTPPPLPRIRPSTSSAPRLQSRCLSFAPPRNLGELGCIQSFLPLHGLVPMACLTVNVQACCELSHVPSAVLVRIASSLFVHERAWISIAKRNGELRESDDPWGL